MLERACVRAQVGASTHTISVGFRMRGDHAHLRRARWEAFWCSPLCWAWSHHPTSGALEQATRLCSSATLMQVRAVRGPAVTRTCCMLWCTNSLLPRCTQMVVCTESADAHRRSMHRRPMHAGCRPHGRPCSHAHGMPCAAQAAAQVRFPPNGERPGSLNRACGGQRTAHSAQGREQGEQQRAAQAPRRRRHPRHAVHRLEQGFAVQVAQLGVQLNAERLRTHEPACACAHVRMSLHARVRMYT